MDRRKLKHAPSLLRLKNSSSLSANNSSTSVDDYARAATSIGVRSDDKEKSPEINRTEARDLSPVLSRRSVSRRNANGSGTQLSHTQSSTNSLRMVTSGSKNQDASPDRQKSDDETEDSDQDFLETTNRNIAIKQKTIPIRPKRKRRSSDNMFSEDELQHAKKKHAQLSSEDDYLSESEMHRPSKHSVDDESQLAKKKNLRTFINLRKICDTDSDTGAESDVTKRDTLGQKPSKFFKKDTELKIAKKKLDKNDSPEQSFEKFIDRDAAKTVKSKTLCSARDSIKNQSNITKKKNLETTPSRFSRRCSSETGSDTDSELHIVKAQKLRRSNIDTPQITKLALEMNEFPEQMPEHSENQWNSKSLCSVRVSTAKLLNVSKKKKFPSPTRVELNSSIDQDSTDLEVEIVQSDKQMQSNFKSPVNLKSPKKAKTSSKKTESRKGVSDLLTDSESDSDDIFNVYPKSKSRTQKSTDPSPAKPNIRSDLRTEKSDSNIKLSEKVHSSFEKSCIRNKNSDLPTSSNPKDMNKSRQPVIRLSGRNVRRNVFEKYLYEAGIVLIDDGENLLCDDQPIIIQKLDALISSNQYKKEEIIKLWEQHIEDIINLQSMLSPTRMANEQEEQIGLSKECVARILLQVPSLQTEVGISLLDRLALAVLTEGSLDDVPWSGLLLRQFRFLDQMINPEALVDKVGELLEAASMCFQREIISYLPDIVIDSQHHTVGEMLRKLIASNSELMPVILDCLSNLMLSADYFEELRNMAIDILKGNPPFSALPAITRFILTDCSTADGRIKALTALRSIDMQPLANENMEECFTNQVLVVSALRMSMLVSPQMADSALIVQQRVKKDPKPLDLIILLLIHSTSTKQKNVEALLKNRVRSGFFRASLLNSLYYDYKEVGRELQTVAISLASYLLKAGDRSYTDFAIEWFRLLFISQADAVHKQREILEKIILLMGVDTQTSKNALAILKKMASKGEEQEHLQKHCHHLRILLEKVDDFNLEEVSTLSDLLHGLCASSKNASDALHDDLDILLHKQLSSVKPLRKCKGVLGGVMALKHLVADSANKERALQLFERVVTAVKSCSRSRSLFYDQMADVIANTENIHESFLEYFTEHFTDELTQLYLTDLKGYSGDLITEFSLNTTAELTADEAFAVTFDGKDGAAVPVLFKLIKVCCMRGSNGDLSPIDALIGCPILISKNFHDPDSAALDQIFHCANWFREIISGFVNQSDSVVQEKLLKRLENLMTLQSQLSMNLTLADSHYQPPVCYFHHFPSPPFVKIESKSTKRGKKSNADKSSLFQWESWESGSALASKNPAYFRRLDAKIAHLLDFNMEVRSTQSTSNSITIAQVCFIIKELLGILDNEVSPVFMKDLVGLLPRVCSKLEQITTELREKDDNQKRECLRLLLHLLAAIFNWKAFHNAVYSAMLREALRVVASQIDESNTLLRSCKELVVQCCLYFESLSDVTTRISIAIALLTVFQSLIQHSESLALEYKEKLAKTAFGFLCLDWPDDKSNLAIYRPAVNTLLNCWIKNESDPLDTVTTMLKWLPEEATKLIKPQDTLNRILSINRGNFSLLLKEVFAGLNNGVKQSLASAKRDIDRIKIWQSLAVGIRNIVQISKALELKALWSLFLRCTPPLLKLFISTGMPVLEHNLKYHTEEVTGVVRQLQEGTKYLHVLCCHTKVSGDATLAKYVPAAKSVLEKLVFTVKGMMVLNNIPQAFWMGNLINRNIKGQVINQESTEDSLASTSSILSDISEELPLNDSDQNTEYDSE